MKVIAKHLTLDIISNSLMAFFVLWLFFFGNQLVRFLNSSAYGSLAASDVWKVLALQTPILATMLLPVSLFFGLIFTYRHFSLSQSALIMLSAGVKPHYFLKLNLKLSFVVAMLAALLAFVANPPLQQQINWLMSGRKRSLFSWIREHQFQAVNKDKYVVHVQQDNQQEDDLARRFNGLFMAQAHAFGQRHCVILAKEARAVKADNQAGHYLKLINGKRYCGMPGSKDYEVVTFDDYHWQLPEPQKIKTNEIGGASFKTLWRRRQELAAKAEWQWRWTHPLSALVLTGIATMLINWLPLRKRHNWTLLGAILSYTFYVNLLFMLRAGLRRGTVQHAWLSLWSVHLGFGLIAALGYLYTSSLKRR